MDEPKDYRYKWNCKQCGKQQQSVLPFRLQDSTVSYQEAWCKDCQARLTHPPRKR